MKNVFIIGDKSFIKSKNALKRLKEQVKNEEDVDSTKYLIKILMEQNIAWEDY